MYKLLGLSEEGKRSLNRAIFACVLTNLAMFGSAATALQIIAVILEPLTGGGSFNAQKLIILGVVGLGAAGLYFLASGNEYRKTYTAAYRESEKIRLDVAEHIRKLPLSFFNRKDLTELTTNLMADCATVEHAMSHVVPGLAANIITITFACVLLALYDWRMTIALFAALPAAAALIVLSKGLQAKYGERQVSAKLDAAERTQEYFEGIKVVKAFGLAGEKSEALKKSFHALMIESFKFEALTGVFIVSAAMVLQTGIGLVTFTGAMLLSGGELEPVKLLFFTLVSAKIYSALIVLLSLLPELFYLLVSTRRMQILRQTSVMEGDGKVELNDFNIELKNVNFGYTDELVIKNVSLKIPQNRVTAFVGPSGSGKTTVSHLIARFWDVRDGGIFIGGKNIKSIDPETLMRYMSFVFQDVTLFNDSVMNNIRIGKKDARDEEVYAAAKTARCDEFILRLPQGYETLIGENGCTLSGGERQRISIARALLKNAPIVLLDEATASLDPENETEIQSAISCLVKDRTVIVIAHRLRTILGADKIAVLENGVLAEEGTGEELVRRNGLFARLYKIQQESLGWTVSKTD
ncbi:MAG: ABC transporter ATP-binding protein/permease [Spirochaetaceae bacterium]|jgi:ATP-binding cassette subfamily B protein|nr:ABC transporter ATP-binding protein/permease [Spirochaetaceae bacterium]